MCILKFLGRRRNLALLALFAIVGVSFTAVLAQQQLANVGETISITVNPTATLAVTGVSLGGNACSNAGGNSWTCATPTLQAGNSLTTVITVQNTGNTAGSAYTLTSCGIGTATPSVGGCSSVATITDASPTSIPAGQTATLSVQFNSLSSLTEDTTVSLSIEVNSA